MRASLLLSWLVAPFLATAQWDAPSANTPVRVAAGVEAVTPLSAPGPVGSTYISWFEQAGSGYVLRMQRLDADGVAMWDPQGLLVSEQPQNSALFRYDLGTDLYGNAIVAFQDERTGTLDIVAALVEPDGNLPWGDGISLPTPGGTGLAPVVGGLANGLIAIAWNTDHSPSTVGYHVLFTDGSSAPIGTQEISSTGNCGRPKVVPCDDAGFWIQYVEQSGNFLSPGTMKAIRFDGNYAPSAPVTVSSRTISGFYFPQPVSDGGNGFYLAFNTGNADNASLTDVVVQRLRADGTTWSTGGTAVEVGTATQRYTMTATPALVSDEEGLMMAYRRTDLNQNTGGIAVQRFDTAGTRLLGNTAVEVLPLSAALHGPFANAAVPGGIVCVQQQGGFGAYTLSAFRLGLDGSVMSPPDEIAVCSVSSGKDDATLVPFRNGQAVAVWTDERSGSGIYAQNIVVDVNLGVPEKQVSGKRIVHGDGVELLFTEGSNGRSTIRLIDAEGRVAASLVAGPQPIGGRVRLPMDALGQGVYLVVVEEGSTREALRAVR